MQAIGMVQDKPGVHQIEIPMPRITAPDEVLMRIKEVGLDGTDFGKVRQNSQDFPEGRNNMALGHETVGVVEAVGTAVQGLAVGDIVVATVRRGCGRCAPCNHNESDLCLTGLYTEHGLHGLDGFLTEFVVDKEQYIVRVPRELARAAVFTEPLSIVEKGTHALRVIQSRLPWFCPHTNHGWLEPEWGGCKVALVVGAGPLGLLATAIIRLAEAFTYTADIVESEDPKARLVKEMGAEYINARDRKPAQMVDFCCTRKGALNIIFEASGAAETAVRLIPFMSPSSIYVMTGIPGKEVEVQVDAARIVRQIVRDNEVVAGSVNSNRRHFEMALQDLPRLRSRFPGVFNKMVTHRYTFDQYQEAFSRSDTERIKTIVEIEPWSAHELAEASLEDAAV